MSEDLIRRFLSYQPTSGELVWLEDKGRASKGDVVKTKNGEGYLVVRIGGKSYLAHRVCWFLHYGSWPTKQINHKHRNRTNNSILNLEDISHAQNMKNKSKRSDCAFITGVTFSNHSNCWRAYVGSNGKSKAEYYDSLIDAVAARIRMLKAENFSETHGK